MSQEQLDNHLYLPSLSIKGFRGIKELSIGRLGRVTLLAGKNRVGKTTVLDAVRVYAARGRHSVLSAVLEDHGEVATMTDTDGRESVGPHLEALFYGRDASQSSFFSIGPNNDSDQLRVETISPEEVPHSGYPPHFFTAPVRTFKIIFQDKEEIIPWFFSPYALSTKMAKNRRVYQYVQTAWMMEHDSPTEIACLAMGPGLLPNDEIVEFWDIIALTDDEERVVNALQPILGDQVERIGIIGDNSNGRRGIAKLQGQAFPVPLESFGDGALRLFGVALALVNSRDGFLLIDEAENGIHHSAQPDFWRMVFKTAHANNVQVIATTHSFDCVRGFAQALTECEEVEGALVRLERENGSLRAVEYSERNLKAAAKQSIGIEVR